MPPLSETIFFGNFCQGYHGLGAECPAMAPMAAVEFWYSAVAFGATSYVPVPVPGPGPGPIQHIGRQRRTTRRRSRQFRRWIQADRAREAAATEPVLLAPVNRTPAEYQAGASAPQGPIEPLESDTVDLAEDQLSSGSAATQNIDQGTEANGETKAEKNTEK